MTTEESISTAPCAPARPAWTASVLDPMPARPSGAPQYHGWIFYDAACALCSHSAALTKNLLARHGFTLVPLQTPGASELVGVTPTELLTRMHLLTNQGRRYAGADALVEIARHIAWARPLAWLGGSAIVLPWLRRAYDWIAANRYCFGGTCQVPRRRATFDWLPLAILPGAVFALRQHMAGWVFMWALALALFAGCKWLTYRKAVAGGAHFGLGRSLGYLLAWVGMEPQPFAGHRPPDRPSKAEWVHALNRALLGAALVWGMPRILHPSMPIAAGWVAMFGIVMLLHFGTFHLLALAWRRVGVPVAPLMHAPLLATSVGDFWGARWNTGFHALAHSFLFRPLRRILGRVPAVLGVFLVSGLVHELVITVPAQGGYGLPTAYFLAQGLGLMVERSTLGRRLGLSAGGRGWLFAIAVTALPAFWLFPPIFVQQIILPMLGGIGAL